MRGVVRDHAEIRKCRGAGSCRWMTQRHDQEIKSEFRCVLKGSGDVTQKHAKCVLGASNRIHSGTTPQFQHNANCQNPFVSPTSFVNNRTPNYVLLTKSRCHCISANIRSEMSNLSVKAEDWLTSEQLEYLKDHVVRRRE